MHGPLSWLSLSMLATLMLGAVSPSGAAPVAATTSRATADAAARKTLQTVVARYRSLASYRLEGQASTEVSGERANNLSTTIMKFVVRRPYHFASEVRGSDMNTRMMADGESVWTAIPDLGQYQVQSFATLLATVDSTALARQLDPAGEYSRLLDGVSSVRALGPDTVRTARGAVACQRYALTSPSGDSSGTITMYPRVVWVDPATHLVLLDSLRIDQRHPQLGDIRSVNLTRMVVAEADPVLAADAFKFHPDADLRRVRRFMKSSPEHTAMEGQPAQDFTLEPLDGNTPVTLSSLKGKVVVLDFWATWCGPCRGWLPIVARARHEFSDKGLLVYAVNEREPETKVRDYLAKQKLDIPVLMDRSGNVGSNYHASSIPLTVVVGRDGNIVRVLLGLHGEDDLKDVLHEAGID